MDTNLVLQFLIKLLYLYLLKVIIFLNIIGHKSNISNSQQILFEKDGADSESNWCRLGTKHFW